MLHGLGIEYDDEIRLNVLQKWMPILYPDQNIDIETLKNGNSVIHTTHADFGVVFFKSLYNARITKSSN